MENKEIILNIKDEALLEEALKEHLSKGIISFFSSISKLLLKRISIASSELAFSVPAEVFM